MFGHGALMQCFITFLYISNIKPVECNRRIVIFSYIARNQSKFIICLLEMSKFLYQETN